MKWLMALALAVPALAVPAFADENVGGFTKEVCSTPTITASSAYTSGNSVGGLITLSPAFLEAGTGVLQSVRITFNDAQTAEFDVYEFSGNPTATIWTDKATPSIAGGDKLLVKPVIKLTNNASGLGTHTVYGVDQIARAVSMPQSLGFGTQADYFVVIAIGTPTFGTATDMQFCAAYLQDR